ncbi:MAG: RNA polymerase subunit sigma-70 [Chloroflexi bacterium]|uniref:RNA polymerase subunit sigma-70 n=1 Tax=Candidatus Flexifilum breve TaxID=3140694 RepID=UPI0031347B83|nr:RNA polymerase subunit sigma-70 [Chloroflexota bacterium]
MLTELNQHEFGSTVEPYRRELQVHCYRLLGSLQDAEDMVQETLLRAWKRRETYTEDISARAWLYKIATNVCLDALKKTRRRVIPKTLRDAEPSGDSVPPPILEPIWLDPYPDDLIPWDAAHPEQQVVTRETVSIAFLAALQLLPPRQRAVLLLSDVLDWSAAEIAALLETTVSAVKSALHRARSAIAAEIEFQEIQEGPLRSDNAALMAQLEAYVRAWETADVDALIDLLRADATFSMPPIPSWYQGTAAIHQIVGARVFAGQPGLWRLLPARANGQIAFGLYRRGDACYAAYGIQIVTFAGDRISDIITFRKPDLVPRFGLPARI